MADVVRPTADLVTAFLADMRLEDKNEIWALTRRGPIQAVHTSVEASAPHTYVAIDEDGAPLSLFGIGSPAPVGRVGVPWMLATNKLQHHRVEMMKVSRDFLRTALNRDFDILTNVVWDEHKSAIRYLKALGFKVEPPRQNPLTLEWYRPFSMKRSDVYV